ncbi:MAG: phosphoribosylanthranilate isomerase [Planctomycetota bacterium]
MFRVKICGVTRPTDAVLAADSGADAIGLNFYAKSKRFVPASEASPIVNAVRGRVTCVGVFVNESPRRVLEIAESVGLDAIQLHGDEPAATLAEFGATPLVRARRLGPGGLAELAGDLTACRDAADNVAALLVDAPAAEGYGGTGHTFEWQAIQGHGPVIDCPLILAGGLKPENVAEAIGVVQPHGVDVASGVESSPGIKDAVKTEAFIRNALTALDRIG